METESVYTLHHTNAPSYSWYKGTVLSIVDTEDQSRANPQTPLPKTRNKQLTMKDQKNINKIPCSGFSTINHSRVRIIPRNKNAIVESGSRCRYCFGISDVGPSLLVVPPCKYKVFVGLRVCCRIKRGECFDHIAVSVFLNI